MMVIMGGRIESPADNLLLDTEFNNLSDVNTCVLGSGLGEVATVNGFGKLHL